MAQEGSAFNQQLTMRLFRAMGVPASRTGYPHLQINLYTNGVLFDEARWEKMRRIQKNIAHVRVSLDGITEDVYNYVRRGGNLERVKKNMTFLSSLRTKGFFKDLVLCFVVQKMNYKDMPAFVEFSKSLPGTMVQFQRIYSWDTYPPHEFPHHDICREDHPEFKNFLSVLKNPVFSDPIVDMGNLIPFRELALAN